VSRVLWRAGLRHLFRHPWLIGLSILGVALGAAVVVSIDLANESARRAFVLSGEAVAGRATHQIVGGPAGLPESLYRALRVEGGIRPSAPIVEADVMVSCVGPRCAGEIGRTLHLVGVDPFAEGPFRPYLGSSSAEAAALLAPLLTRPDAALLAAETAQHMGLQAGDRLVLRAGSRTSRLTLAGVLQPHDALSRRALEGLLIVDIATAQEILDMAGRLSRIDLIVPEGPAGEAMLQRVRAALPPGAEILRAGARTEALEQMTRAFTLNLTALSLQALIVGMFLIYNTMTFTVVQRRTLIGTLRAVGVTRSEILALILGEALAVGVLGTVLGLVLGVVLARGLVRLVTQTINDVYFTLTVSSLALEPLVLLKGAVLGLGATLVSALAPAIEATGAPPRAVLSRSVVEARLRFLVPRAAAAGVLLLLLSLFLLIVPSRSLLLSFGALFAIILGCALLTPLATIILMGLPRLLLGRAFGTLGRMAARGVVASLSRTAVAIAALMVAVSVTVGVGTMVSSFRQTVVRWLATSLRADVYVAPPTPASGSAERALDPALVERLTHAPGIEAFSTYRGVTIDTPAGLVRLVAIRIEPRVYAAFEFKEGRPEEVWPAFQQAGAVIISEPFAYRHRLHAGDVIRLRTDRGEHAFRIAGVFYDYGSDQGVVMLSRTTYEQFWDDRGISSLGLYAAPGIDVDALVEELRRLAGPDQEVVIRSNRALRQASLEVFDRTFLITGVLRLLAMLVAFIGVLTALMALQLERARELGVLRALGLTPRQVWGLVTAQTGLMGLAAGVLALPTGTALALVLIYVVNLRSFGWTLQFQFQPLVLAQAIALAVGAAVLAGIYPAWKMARTSPALALREE